MAAALMRDTELVGFARAVLAPALGDTPRGWFSLAGGAFKTLLHGRPPRDLDLWPATAAGRRELHSLLLASGATVRRDNPPYQTAYAHGKLSIDLAYDVSFPNLRSRLRSFDIALSAIGVECRDGRWRAEVHPLARESVARGEVLLLKPLVNWKYALATLDRLRRYAAELGFAVPAGEERVVWEVFEAQPAAGKEAMIERYLRVAAGDEHVLAEARERLGAALEPS